MVRQMATGRDAPEGMDNVMELWRGFLESEAGQTFEGLAEVLDDQAEFARFTRQVIDDLGYGDQLGDDPDAEDDESESEAEDDQDEESTDPGNDDSQEDDQSETAETEQAQADMDQVEAQFAEHDLDDSEMSDEGEFEDTELPPDMPPPPVSDADRSCRPGRA